ERHACGGRPGLQRGGPDGDGGALPVLRPRVHHEAHGEARERAADGGIVLAGDHDTVAHMREHDLHAPAHDRLALEFEEELLTAHAPGEPGGEHDGGDHGNVEPSGAREPSWPRETRTFWV